MEQVLGYGCENEDIIFRRAAVVGHRLKDVAQ
jgi:hypothetical protein